MPETTISVIIPTRNSSATLFACLKSIQAQTQAPAELIIVDRDSTDQTVPLAKTYTKHVFNHGPERSAQRNYGASKATGDVLLFIDSDMELTPNVIEQTATAFTKDPPPAAVIIPKPASAKAFGQSLKPSNAATTPA